MAAINNDDASVISYGESIANFGAAYAATQELVRSQGTTIASMQSQLQAMHQYCMALQQQPPPTIYMAQQQQQRGRRGALRRNNPPTSGGNQAPVGPFPGPTNASKIGTTAIRTTGTSTTPTPAQLAKNQGHHTTRTQQG
jgi:hypothetical protein